MSIGLTTIPCPACGRTPIKLSDAAFAWNDGIATKRRRYLCLACGHKWTTFEIPVPIFRALVTRHELADYPAPVCDASDMEPEESCPEWLENILAELGSADQ